MAGEQQCYVDRPENLRVENGRLILEARRGAYTGVPLSQGGWEGLCFGGLEVLVWGIGFEGAGLKSVKHAAAGGGCGAGLVRAE